MARISPVRAVDHYLPDGEKTTSPYRGALVPVPGVPLPDGDVSSKIAWQLGRLLTLNNSAVAIQMLQQREAAKLAAYRQSLQNAAADRYPPIFADKAPAAVMEYIAEKLKGVSL